MPQGPSIAGLLELEQLIDIVDIGAAKYVESPPYKPLMDSGRARLVGFEPNPEALDQLNAQKGPNETYLPHAVYDGNEQELKVCTRPGCTSLLEPNFDLLSYFLGHVDIFEVKERVSMPTVRLDDVKEIKNIDYLKIDIQGAELGVFENGANRLRDCLVIQTEVEFLPMYEGQPLFSEVDIFLRGLGFMIHRFYPLVERIVQPMILNNDPQKSLGQVMWADAIFVKDFTKFDQLGSQQLLKLALILHDVYGSFDIALRALMAYDSKGESNLAEQYKQHLQHCV